MNKFIRWRPVITVIWVAVIAIILWNDQNAQKHMSLNAVGDFLAGTMSPLAMFWLVIAYYQQNEDLELTREEMRCQSGETRELVSVTSRQASIMQNEFQIKHDPIFVCETPTTSTGASKYSVGIKIVNVGGKAINLSIHPLDNTNEITIDPFTHVDQGESVNIRIEHKGPMDKQIFFVFSYQSVLKKKTKFQCCYDKNNFVREEFFSKKIKETEGTLVSFM
jgi:hypothetical protein